METIQTAEKPPPKRKRVKGNAPAGFGAEPQSLMPRHIQPEHHRCLRRNVARLTDAIRFINGLNRCRSVKHVGQTCRYAGDRRAVPIMENATPEAISGVAFFF